MPYPQKLPEALDKVIAASGEIGSKASEAGPLGARRPSRTIAISAALLFGLFVAARTLLESPTLPTVARVLIALAPVAALVWMISAFVRDVRHADELERTIQLEALAVAFPLTLILITTLGLLQLAIPLSPDDWSYRHVWPLLYVFYLFGLSRARHRYQ